MDSRRNLFGGIMKTVLLTGGVGFIGHHTTEHILRNTSWNIVIIDRLTYAGNINYLTDMECWAGNKHRVKFIYHDLRSPFSETTISLLGKIDYIIHMAAETHVDKSIEDPMPFAESNVIGTVNMLELAKKLDPEKFIYISTDEVYGPTKDGKLHKEGEPHKPSNPYSASKSGAEAFCYSYWNTYGLPVIITNTMNNYGERQHPEKFVPKTVKAIMQGKKVTLHCKTENKKVVEVSSRCWLHARNHADGILYVIKYGQLGENYNITGEHATVEELADMIGEILGQRVIKNFIDFHAFRPGHDMHYGLDGSKLKELGWKPPKSLKNSLVKTIEWMKENPKWLL